MSERPGRFYGSRPGERDPASRLHEADAASRLQQLPIEAQQLHRVPGIVFADQVTGRRPRIAGSGVDVWEVVRDYQVYGHDRAAVARIYGHLTPAQIDVALAYYTAYPETIDAWIEEERSYFAMLGLAD